jgi:hypothetical protein
MGQALHEQSQAPSPGPSHVAHSNAEVESSDAGTPPANADDNLSDAGMPGKDADVDPLEASMPQVDGDVDQEPHSELEMWDSNAGLKPSQSDGYALDDSVEFDDLPEEGADFEIQNAMLNMMIELEDDDQFDFEWLPPKECKTIVPKEIGMIMIDFTA